MEFKTTITISDEEFAAFAESIMENYPEYSSGNCMKCRRYKYDLMEFTFRDEETEKEYKLDKEKIHAGLKKFLEEKFEGKYPGILQGIPMSEIFDAGHWDAYATDAVVQMACLGEVVYG